MDITWTQTSSGQLQLSHKNSKTNYKVFQTKIFNKTTPISVIQSPETEKIMIAVEEGQKLTPARLYLGMDRAIDLNKITHTIASTKEFKKAINHQFIPEKESISVMLMRETLAQAPFLNMFLGSNFQSRLYVVMDIHHVKDKKGLKGLGTKVCTYRIDIPKDQEEKISKDIKLAIFYDSIAGGRNLKKAFQELKEKFVNLEKAVFVSIYATYEGCLRIAKCCKQNGVESEFFCAHELLKANPINQYDCFYPPWNIEKNDEKILKSFYGKEYRNICLGGDFTANIFGTEQAKDVFYSQISELGLKMEDIIKNTTK
jgi:hypothetical protein